MIHEGDGKTPSALLCSEAPHGIPVRTMRLRAIMERRLVHARLSLPAAPGRGLLGTAPRTESAGGPKVIEEEDHAIGNSSGAG